MRSLAAASLIAALMLLAAPNSQAFSVLAHQAVVDQAWESTLLPLIRGRFPNASEQDLADTQSYARGGSHLADLGYFPLGNRTFTDLLHYVRSGDFVSRLLAEARTPREYAFALGALDHYVVDSIGHPEATNRAVAIMYPKLARKHGDHVTYADSPSAHLQTEFRFDVLQVAHRGEIPGLFEHSIEFNVPRDFVERVFQETYGLKLDDLFKNYDVALATYRWAFRTLIDEGTGIAWQLYRSDIESLEPGMTAQHFLHAMSRADFIKQFGQAFEQPGYFVRFVALLGNLVPNIGPFRRLPYKPLPEDVRKLYFDAARKASAQYRNEVEAARGASLRLVNLNLDTGEPSRPGAYEPADKAYAELLRLDAEDHFARMPKTMADDLLNHFRDRNAALSFKESSRKRKKTLEALNELESRALRDAQ